MRGLAQPEARLVHELGGFAQPWGGLEQPEVGLVDDGRGLAQPEAFLERPEGGLVDDGRGLAQLEVGLVDEGAFIDHEGAGPGDEAPCRPLPL